MRFHSQGGVLVCPGWVPEVTPGATGWAKPKTFCADVSAAGCSAVRGDTASGLHTSRPA